MHISVKSKKRIIVAANPTRYYTQVSRSITPANMSWRTLANFDMQWQAIIQQEKQDDPEVPKLGNNGSILKWIESFKLHTKFIIGVRMCSLSYALDDAASKATAGQTSSHISRTRLIMVQPPRNLPPSHCMIIPCTL